MLNKKTVVDYIGHCLDDSLNVRTLADMPANARFVVYACGFEPMVVAVWSYLPGVTLDESDAEDIARDYLLEINWFADADAAEADCIL